MPVRTFNRAALKTTVCLCCTAILTGCLSNQRRTQLDRVAKDWCETIRAAQVIPVFPMKEDLQPGDVFLVQRSLADQQKDFAERGPLALDFHLARLGKQTCQSDGALNYALVYFDAYFKDAFGLTPHERIVRKPGDATVFIERMPAPAVAFPAYSFEVTSGSSANLAIPLQGVPVALSFMQTGKATGSVNLQDAYSYAADAGQTFGLLQQWAEECHNRVQLNAYVEKNGGKPVYLRVVTEVFLVGGVTVSLFNQELGGVSGSAGEVPALTMLDPSSGKLSDNYTKLLDVLSARASGSADPAPAAKPATLPAATSPASTSSPAPTDVAAPLVGGNVKFTWAGQRNISMDERFARPLVVGFMGFDVPVYSGGAIGYPLPTFARLAGKNSNSDTPISTLSPGQLQAMANLDWLTKNPPDAMVVLPTMKRTIAALGSPIEYADALKAIELSVKAPTDASLYQSAKKSFEDATIAYLAVDTTHVVRPAAFNAAFVGAQSAK